MSLQLLEQLRVLDANRLELQLAGEAFCQLAADHVRGQRHLGDLALGQVVRRHEEQFGELELDVNKRRKASS